MAAFTIKHEQEMGSLKSEATQLLSQLEQVILVACRMAQFTNRKHRHNCKN